MLLMMRMRRPRPLTVKCSGRSQAVLIGVFDGLAGLIQVRPHPRAHTRQQCRPERRFLVMLRHAHRPAHVRPITSRSRAFLRTALPEATTNLCRLSAPPPARS